MAKYASVVAVVGLGVLAAGALPHAASVALSDAYHLATATDVERAALAATWAGNQATMTMLLVTGLAIVPVGVVGLGAAMLRSPAFGRAIGWSTVGLGGVGAVVAVVLLVDPVSPVAAVGFFALIAFQLVAGWRLYALSSPRAATDWQPLQEDRRAEPDVPIELAERSVRHQQVDPRVDVESATEQVADGRPVEAGDLELQSPDPAAAASASTCPRIDGRNAGSSAAIGPAPSLVTKA